MPARWVQRVDVNVVAALLSVVVAAHLISKHLSTNIWRLSFVQLKHNKRQQQQKQRCLSNLLHSPILQFYGSRLFALAHHQQIYTEHLTSLYSYTYFSYPIFCYPLLLLFPPFPHNLSTAQTSVSILCQTLHNVCSAASENWREVERRVKVETTNYSLLNILDKSENVFAILEKKLLIIFWI